MRIRINDPTAADELLAALAAADCVAERTDDDAVEVDVRWADGDHRQAEIELSFFVKAWQAQRPGLVAVVGA
ncbi:MAG: hypothetical protein ICV64_00160 [Thermoleophilia bacterium]|nr:hypothetical protein [Thermoleophilia bacterium]